jgi:hypothetical protein
MRQCGQSRNYGENRHPARGRGSVAKLRVHPGHLSAIGSDIASAAATASTAVHTTAVLPAGRDPVSVVSAQAVSSRNAQIVAHSVHAGHVVAAAGAMLRADARIYADTETVNGRALGATGSDAMSMPASTETPSAPPPVAAVAPPVSTTPSLSGREIAQLLHAGTGPASLSAAVAEMTAHAADLADTRARLSSAAADMVGAWNSNASHAANSRIRELAAWHRSHAGHARIAAKAAGAQAENFHQARTDIPCPDDFAAVERRLRAAARANAAPPAGRYTAVITDMQYQLAHLNERAVTGYARYAAATDATLAALRSPIQPLDWRPGRLASAQRAEPVLGFDPAVPLGGNLAAGGGAVIVWCVPLASGYRCTNLFTDGTYAVYPSPTDRTGAWW